MASVAGKGFQTMWRQSVLLAILLTLASAFSFAQTQAINGSIRGRVIDPAGAAVPASTVSVNNIATGFTRGTESNDDGYFVIPNLPIGTYTVTIKKDGFETQRHSGVVLDAGTEAVIDSELNRRAFPPAARLARWRSRICR